MRVEEHYPSPWTDEPVTVEQVPESVEDQELLDYQTETQQDIGPFASQVDENRWDLERAGVERIVKRMRGLAQDEKVATAFCDAEIEEASAALARLQARRDEMLKPIQRRREWLARYIADIQAWAARELYGRKERSLNLTYGTLKFRKSPDRVDVTDEAAAIAWAQEAGYQDVLVIHASKTAIKRRIKDTGEVVPGAAYVVGEDKFEIDVLEAD